MSRRSLTAVLVLVGCPVAAQADDFSVKLEPGLAMPLTSPQSNIYDDGGSQSLKALFGITPYLDVGPAVTFMVLPAAVDGMESGIAWGFGAGGRLKRPHDAVTYSGVSPWLDADALFIRTGPLDRAGFDTAVGLAIPLDDARRYWIGPFVRYSQTGQSDRAGYDNSDAKILTIGVSVEVDSGRKRPSLPEDARIVVQERIVTKEVPASDRDGDGIPDTIDHCPDVAGPMDNWGCPNYTKIVVKKDKLELKEKLYFAWDQAKLEDTSFPVLDEVVQALKDNQGFRVQIEGHTSSEGGDDHNQTLSEQRAATVLGYLASHGIARDRLVSKGFASSKPIDTNATAAGRENNRRVEFIVNFVILNTGGAQ